MEGSVPISSSKRLKGKVTIITGGASGIGAAAANLFLNHGAKVIIGDVQDELGLKLCNELGEGENISYVHCDVTSESDVRDLVDTAISKYGKLDIMYNNAGISGETIHPSILDTKNEDFRRVLDVNLYGAFLGAKHAARVMIPAKKGVVLFTASTAAECHGLFGHHYSVSKGAVVSLMKNLCVELGQYGIRVNSVSPGALPTPLVLKRLGLEKSQLDEITSASLVLSGVVAKVEHVAEAVLFLASDEANIISGQNLLLDGGYSTTNPTFPLKMKECLS